MPKVSIIVPVYNAEDYLDVCLKSLVNQSFDDLEIIVIDDASSDNSLKIIKEYADKYSFVKAYYNDENLGQSVTRNKGLDLAKGEYIGFLDADDYVSLDMYKTMYNAALKSDFPDIIISSLAFVKDNSRAFKSYDRDLNGRCYNVLDNPNLILDQSPSCCNKLFSKKLIGDYRFIPGVMWEDVAFTYSNLIKADRILMMNNVDYFYRRDISKGVSSKGYRSDVNTFDAFTVAKEIEKVAKECDRYEALGKQVKFLQMACVLQRISEIECWPEDISGVKEEMYGLILENFGDLNGVDTALLSSRVSLDVIKEFEEFSQNKSKRL